MAIQWPLVFFTLFMCATAGVLGGLGVLVIGGKGRKIYLPGIITAAVLLVLGVISSFMHLQHWQRIFNGFGNITSGITQELIAIVLAIVALVVFFALIRRAADDKPIAKWIGWVMLAIGIILAVVCALSYLMVSRPAWGNATGIFYFVASALVLGAAIIWVLAALKDEEIAPCSAFATFVAGIIAAVTVIIFAIVALNAEFTIPMAYFDPVTPTEHLAAGSAAIAEILKGSGALAFWGGALVLGAIVPAICGILAKKLTNAGKILAFVAVICALIGGICFRAVFYQLGVSVFGIF